ncbi:SDR family oxidoreductase [Niastella caeni]|uniref:SDR family oxidoreductase n=1 Tax=Niastella caeni TaxID=2569763 RepID=A0A4S8HZL1_9BACT|nr:SDR family oxidoreductase [Niastella caeni]THU41130.1 SDR family oxidoreductase [Niastella caeni]
MILVTAATGHLGTATIDYLLKKVPANQVTALVRDEQKAANLAAKSIALRKGDYHDAASLKTAFQGISTLVFISSGSLEDRVGQHQNVVNAAKASGVQHILYTSVLKASDSLKFLPAIDHYHTETLLKQSGISFTFFRNTFYAEVLPMLFGGALESGQWFYAAGNAKVNFAARTDMAEAIANVATSPAAHINKIYEIAGNQSYTFPEIAGVISKTIGKTVSYIPVPLDALKEGMKQAGVPEAYIPMYASIAEAISAGELDTDDRSLENLLNRKPVDLKEYLPKLLGA